MTAEQRKILNELAEFAPCLKGQCKDFNIRKDEFAPLKNYLAQNSCGEVMVPGFIKINLHNVVDVKYKQARRHEDYYYVKVVIKRKLTN
jgi:hypothetical protein